MKRKTNSDKKNIYIPEIIFLSEIEQELIYLKIKKLVEKLSIANLFVSKDLLYEYIDWEKTQFQNSLKDYFISINKFGLVSAFFEKNDYELNSAILSKVFEIENWIYLKKRENKSSLPSNLDEQNRLFEVSKKSTLNDFVSDFYNHNRNSFTKENKLIFLNFKSILKEEKLKEHGINSVDLFISDLIYDNQYKEISKKILPFDYLVQGILNDYVENFKNKALRLINNDNEIKISFENFDINNKIHNIEKLSNVIVFKIIDRFILFAKTIKKIKYNKNWVFELISLNQDNSEKLLTIILEQSIKENIKIIKKGIYESNFFFNAGSFFHPKSFEFKKLLSEYIQKETCPDFVSLLRIITFNFFEDGQNVELDNFLENESINSAFKFVLSNKHNNIRFLYLKGKKIIEENFEKIKTTSIKTNAEFLNYIAFTICGNVDQEQLYLFSNSFIIQILVGYIFELYNGGKNILNKLFLQDKENIESYIMNERKNSLYENEKIFDNVDYKLFINILSKYEVIIDDEKFKEVFLISKKFNSTKINDSIFYTEYLERMIGIISFANNELLDSKSFHQDLYKFVYDYPYNIKSLKNKSIEEVCIIKNNFDQNEIIANAIKNINKNYVTEEEIKNIDHICFLGNNYLDNKSKYKFNMFEKYGDNLYSLIFYFLGAFGFNDVLTLEEEYKKENQDKMSKYSYFLNSVSHKKIQSELAKELFLDKVIKKDKIFFSTKKYNDEFYLADYFEAFIFNYFVNNGFYKTSILVFNLLNAIEGKLVYSNDLELTKLMKISFFGTGYFFNLLKENSENNDANKERKFKEKIDILIKLNFFDIFQIDFKNELIYKHYDIRDFSYETWQKELFSVWLNKLYIMIFNIVNELNKDLISQNLTHDFKSYLVNDKFSFLFKNNKLISFFNYDKNQMKFNICDKNEMKMLNNLNSFTILTNGARDSLCLKLMVNIFFFLITANFDDLENLFSTIDEFKDIWEI